jgi:hypothetical protein
MKMFLYRATARFLRKRGWIVFYLKSRKYDVAKRTFTYEFTKYIFRGEYYDD